MISSTKNYKIIVDSKHFGNMKGISPAEVAKKAAGKILGLSNDRNRFTKFSMIETKNGKIRNYKAFKESLIRPYKKNGKLITCRIIVKKNSKHTGGGEAEILSQIYKKSEFSEEDKEKIKDAMCIENIVTKELTKYEPFNLTTTIKKVINDAKSEHLGSTDFFELGKNDPILQFFPISEFDIYFHSGDRDDVGLMILRYKNKFNKRCYILYEFTGDDDTFHLHIYNLESCNELEYSEFMALYKKWAKYKEFLHKLYPHAFIYIYYYPERSFSNSNRNRLKKLKYENFRRFFKKDPEPLNSNFNNSDL